MGYCTLHATLHYKQHQSVFISGSPEVQQQPPRPWRRIIPSGPPSPGPRSSGWRTAPSPASWPCEGGNACCSSPPFSVVWWGIRAGGSAGQSWTCHGSNPSRCFLHRGRAWPRQHILMTFRRSICIRTYIYTHTHRQCSTLRTLSAKVLTHASKWQRTDRIMHQTVVGQQSSTGGFISHSVYDLQSREQECCRPPQVHAASEDFVLIPCYRARRRRAPTVFLLCW